MKEGKEVDEGVGERLGESGNVRSYIGWRGKRNIPYMSLETSP